MSKDTKNTPCAEVKVEGKIKPKKQRGKWINVKPTSKESNFQNIKEGITSKHQLSILNCLEKSKIPLSISMISKKIGIPQSTISNPKLRLEALSLIKIDKIIPCKLTGNTVEYWSLKTTKK